MQGVHRYRPSRVLSGCKRASVKRGNEVTKTAIVTGISGQDGAYLAENLLGRGYTVYGTYRRTSSVNFWRIDETLL